MSQRRGDVLRLVGGPWDGQEVFVPTTPRKPHEMHFPALWHDGTWDNAHLVWRYWLEKESGPGGEWIYKCHGLVAAPGLTATEREISREKLEEGLIVGDPEQYSEVPA